ncbi:MAG: NTP transferase domain-containing protein [Pseudonocardiaceae bacterium]|nr:NTP transferase domain-containing protein [Pseudonocardiaceae bacterium]
MGPVVAGLLLAAGAGRRYGMPKALVDDGGWLRRSVAALADGGCDPVLVVLGAAAEQATALLPDGARTVVAPDWEEGMGASLRTGLAALARPDAVKGTFTASGAVTGPFTAAEGEADVEADVEAALVHLVDLPDIGAAVVRRVIGHAAPDAVARAAFDGRHGHPVLLGRDHWEAVMAGATGDRGARHWLIGRADLILVDCTDLATGTDVDRAPDGNP